MCFFNYLFDVFFDCMKIRINQIYNQYTNNKYIKPYKIVSPKYKSQIDKGANSFKNCF